MTYQKLAVVACGVLGWNLRRVADRMDGPDLRIETLPAGLHRNPSRLRELLQERIDEIARDATIDAIVLGYGVCGRGTVGLKAPRIPLLIPRTQDCIGIFLGSHHRYLQEFSRRPGTRYMSQGWYESMHGNEAAPAPEPGEKDEDARERSLYGPEFDALAERYGRENARYICEFRNSWQKNYQRAAYIRYPGEEVTPPGERITIATAESLDWEHETLEGDESLIEALLSGQAEDPRILEVPPHARTVGAPGGAVIGFTTGLHADSVDLLDRFRSRHDTQTIERTGVGLGIDTGGTFTDAAIYDFESRTVLTWAKAPTDHGNLIAGIRAVLRQLPPDSLQQINRVGISTTLATNAFVENKGRPVALLTMAPWKLDTDGFAFRFARQIRGEMTMDGIETTAVDPGEVERAAKAAADEGCEAFAISGFAGVINPEHEKQVADVAYRATGLHAVCGHELTTRLNFRERATTAAMNARLVPLLEALLDAIGEALTEQGLDDRPVMVVKGDGSQMLDRVARMLPVETLLSGPAASVVGAATLVDTPDAVVADLGGTTLDVASLRDGIPVRSDFGARVGDFQTSVDAMAVRTIGLGGDSEIDLADWPRVRIGPRRITPICRMTTDHPDTIRELRDLRNRYLPRECNGLDFVARRAQTTEGNRVLETVTETPRLLADIAHDLNRPAPRFLEWRELETTGRIQRYGLTLTDILHVQGKYDAFDREAAQLLFDAWVTVIEADPDEVIDGIHAEFRRMVTNEVLGVSLPTHCPWDDSTELREWLCRHLSADEDGGDTRLACRLGMPLVGVGAPASALFPQMRDTFGQDVLLPEHAGVANAVGAVAGNVMLRQEAKIRITEEGVFVCSWRGGNDRTYELEKALDLCAAALDRELRKDAEANGIPWHQPAINATERSATTRDGIILLGVDLEAELRG